MTDDRERTRPNDDALTEPTEGHVDVDAVTGADLSQPNETIAGVGGSAGGKPAGILAGAGLTDHTQPAEGGREEEADVPGAETEPNWHPE